MKMENVTEVVLSCQAELLKSKNIDMQPNLDNPFGRESGIDSLGIVNFIMDIEEKLNIDLDDKLSDIRKCKTFREVVEIIKK